MRNTSRKASERGVAARALIRTIEAMLVIRSIVAAGLAATSLAAAVAVAPPTTLAHRPLVITRGGTYSGSFSSGDARVPAVMIQTAEPVILEKCILTGRGHLVDASVHHVNLTIRNVRGIGVNSNVAGRSAGRFVHIEQFDNLVIEHCLLQQTAGIYALDYAGDRTPASSVRIVANRAINIDGRKSDGKGGYVPGDDCELVQFVQLDKVRHLTGAEIAWNEVTNEPLASRVEDNISIYLSSGTADSPIRIHDNFIRGAYPIGTVREGVFAGEYSGGGIMLGDGVGDSPEEDPCFVHAYDNVVLDTVNHGIAISAGHDNRIDRNRVISAGVLQTGQRIAAQNVGIYIWDSYKAGKTHFFNNRGSDNVAGWAKGSSRNDWWIPDAAEWKGNKSIAFQPPITRDTYEQEHLAWDKRRAAASIAVGPSTR